MSNVLGSGLSSVVVRGDAQVAYKQSIKKKSCGGKVLTYIGEDAVTLLTNAALETEGQVVAADHDAAAKALLKWLNIWLDA